MEAPDRLYLSKGIYATFMYQVPNPDDKTEVKYVREDAFIEKACKWLRKELVNFEDYSGMGEELISDFRKAMEE